MSLALQNQLLVNVGSLITANGAILLLSPPRFARLRTTGFTPKALDDRLAYLADNIGIGRGVGMAVLLLGLTMMTVGLRRTRPLT